MPRNIDSNSRLVGERRHPYHPSPELRWIDGDKWERIPLKTYINPSNYRRTNVSDEAHQQ
jgi:hypothetical protein